MSNLHITKHAYRRARQRLGLNKKAFKRAVENKNIPKYCELIILKNRIVTVKNSLSVNRDTSVVINKLNRENLIIERDK